MPPATSRSPQPHPPAEVTSQSAVHHEYSNQVHRLNTPTHPSPTSSPTTRTTTGTELPRTAVPSTASRTSSHSRAQAQTTASRAAPPQRSAHHHRSSGDNRALAPSDLPPPYEQVAPAPAPARRLHHPALLDANQTPASSPAQSYTIHNNYYLLPSHTVLSTVRPPVSHHPRCHRRTSNDAGMEALQAIFHELGIDQRSRELIVGGLAAAPGSVDWQLLLTNSSSVNSEHIPILLDIIRSFQG